MLSLVTARHNDNNDKSPPTPTVKTGVISDDKGATGYTYTLVNGKPSERRSQLWYIKLKNPLF